MMKKNEYSNESADLHYNTFIHVEFNSYNHTPQSNLKVHQTSQLEII